MSTKVTEFTCEHCGISKSLLFHWTRNICKTCCCLYTPCGKCEKLIFWKLVYINDDKNEANQYRCLNCLKKENKHENRKKKI